ncbi:MAG: ABC transporter permease [Thermomonas sp.]
MSTQAGDVQTIANRNLVALGTVARREVMRILRIWTQTLIPPAITMTLYFMIFGGLIGSRVGKMDGISYMDFIVPGLVMMSVIQNSYGNISSSFFGAKFGRHIEELLVSPMPNWVILGGYVAGAMLRGVLVGAIVLVIAMFFTKVQVPHPLVTLTSVLLGSVIFSLAGFINAVFAKKFDDVAIVPTFILTPLTYLGGVFYSIKLLPDWAQAATHMNPIFYMVNAFRYGLLGISDVPLWVAYALMLGFVAVLGGLSLWLLKRGTGMRS